MRRIAIIAITCILLPVASASADEFDCIRALRGGTVKWDMDWQRDRQDQDVSYRITNITESQIHRNLKEVAVELLAEGPAKFPKRISRIKLDYAAEIFCKRGEPAMKQPVVLVRTSSQIQNSPEVKKFAPSELPYRAFESGKWRAKRVPEGVQLRVCATRDSLFACSDGDLQYIRQADLDGRVHHQYPWIRFVDGGWVRGQESDLPRVGSVATCSAMGRKFSCLAEEKNSFSQQLEKISERKVL